MSSDLTREEEETLEHFGVRGMHWGVRNHELTTSGRAHTNREVKDARRKVRTLATKKIEGGTAKKQAFREVLDKNPKLANTAFAPTALGRTLRVARTARKVGVLSVLGAAAAAVVLDQVGAFSTESTSSNNWDQDVQTDAERAANQGNRGTSRGDDDLFNPKAKIDQDQIEVRKKTY